MPHQSILKLDWWSITPPGTDQLKNDGTKKRRRKPKPEQARLPLDADNRKETQHE